MTLQRIKKTFLNRDSRAPYVGYPVTVHAGLSLGSPLRLYADEAGLTPLSTSGTILTDNNGSIDVWVQDYPYYVLIIRTVDRRSIIDRIQTFGYGPVDTEGIESLSAAEVDALREFLVGSGGGTSEVLSVAGRTGIVVLSSSDVGLSNVDNTADLDKPVSSAQAAALAAKLNASLVSPYMLTLLDDTSAPAARSTLGLGTASTQNSDAFATASHTQPISSVTLLQETLDGKQSSLQFQNEGVNLGTGGTAVVLNFTGDGVEASRAGNVVTVNVPGGGSGGVTDHSQLTGLSGDHHLQYLTNTRGDARYSLLGHVHPNANGLTSGFMSNTDKAKLDGIAAGATVNASDATLVNRANHTGTQVAATISDLSEAIDDRVSTLLVAGANISLVYNDVANTLTISSSGGGGGSTPTNLAAVASPTSITVTSDTGTDATLGAADNTNAGLMLPAEKTKLAGIATGATANSPDAALLARSNHTGTQAASTISDFSEAVDDRISSLLVAGTNITLSYNDAANTLTISSTGGGGGGATNLAALASPTTVTITSDTGADATIAAASGTNAGLFLPGEKTKLAAIEVGATANSPDATLLNRTNHTGTQAASTISDFAEAVDDRVSSLLVAGSNINLAYNDGANTLTISATGGSVPIVVTGTLGVGNTLTATLSGGFATGFQWYRDGVAIGGATNIDGTGTISTYLQDSADIGTVLSVRAVGYVPMTVAGTVPIVTVDTRPRFGLGAANAYLSPATLLGGMTPIPGSVDNGRDGSFNLTTTAGNYGWVAVVAASTTTGLRFFDGLGYGGWSGAGLAGNNLGESPDPSQSAITYNDGTTVWRFFRQDFINANPTAASYTIS